jgi:hypothetical protein
MGVEGFVIPGLSRHSRESGNPSFNFLGPRLRGDDVEGVSKPAYFVVMAGLDPAIHVLR